MRSRARPPKGTFTASGLGLAVVLLVLASCQRAERHRMLTYFFDGVPSLNRTGPGIGPFEPNAVEAASGTAAGGWHVHEAIRDCTNCHGTGQRVSLAPKVNLVAEIPNLCYGCHEGYAALEGWVHGPVTTGDCLLCHEQHKSRNEFLLKAPVPDLCYRCHTPDAVQTVENHGEPSYSHCIDCHTGHASPSRRLLSPAFLRGPAGSAYLSDVRRQQYEQTLQRAGSDLERGGDVPALLQAAIEHLEEGRLTQARAYLEVVVNSDLLTESEGAMTTGILQQVVALHQAQSVGQTDAAGQAEIEPLAAALRQIQQKRSERDRALAELYYRSIKLYRAGRLAEARQGFLEVLNGGPLLGPVEETVESYLERIDRGLQGPGQSTDVR